MRQISIVSGLLKCLIIAGIMTMTAIALASCATSKGTAKAPYTEARNYFFRNDATVPTSPLIDNRHDFDRLFGAAAFMGDNGRPTKIDFKKSFVIAVVLPETDVDTSIEIDDMTVDKSTLTLKYAVKTGNKNSYTTRPMAVVVVDNKFKRANVVLKRK